MTRDEFIETAGLEDGTVILELRGNARAESSA